MKKIITFIMLIIIFLIPNKAFASTGDFFIDNLDINAQILPNGDVEVNETIKYRFEGDFNGIFRNLKLNGTENYIINGISIIDENGNVIETKEGKDGVENTYEINATGGSTQVKIYSKSKNENKSFNLKYTIKGAAKKFTDYSNLNWNFYEVENVASIGAGTLKISLKDRKFEENSYTFTVFGDGDIKYNSSLEGVDIQFKDLTSLIGINLQFKKDYLPMAEEISVNNENKNGNSFEENFNGPEENNDGVGILVLLGLAFGAAIVITIISKNAKFQHEVEAYRKTAMFTVDEYVIEPPSEEPPAIVNLLIKEHYVIDEMVNTTLFYLANKGYYSLEEKQIKIKGMFKDNAVSDLIFTRVKEYKNPEYSHLSFIQEWFKEYEENRSFSLNKIKNTVKASQRAKDFVNNFEQWKIFIKEDAERKGMYIKIREKDVVENNWYLERKRWLSYKKYLRTIDSVTNIQESKLSDLTVIYAQALCIDNNDLENLVNYVSRRANNNSFGYSNSIFLHNYLLYTVMFNDINISAHQIANPPSSSTDFNNTGGFSGGGDFSGGGGGGSGAF